jgi:hypothetical protein
MGRARDLANILSSSGNVALDTELGLSLITPTSIVATGGTGSISSNGAVTFTTCTAISLNGVFSNTYDNYKVVISGVTQNSSAALWDTNIRLRSSDIDASGNNYTFQMSRVYGEAGTGVNAQYGATATYWYLGSQNTGAGATDGFFSLEFCNPFLSKSTELLFSVINFQSDTNRIYKAGGATHSVTSPYDGFTFYPSGGTLSGTMRIYGYRN